MSKKSKRVEPLEQGLLQAFRALDNQVARELQRSPAERTEHGVQKWEPYQKRIEKITIFLLERVGSGELQLDSLLISSQAITKALQMVVHDLEGEGLGKVRTGYCIDAMENIAEDTRRALECLTDRRDLV